MSSFLEQYKRQPKIYIDLPMARFYPEGCLADGQSVSLPVYGMTAADEITLKTPDALFSGEATKEVIKSCIPGILDPGSMPSLDIDYCLVAIRIATYGTELEMNVTCPKCDTRSKFGLDLQKYLDSHGARVFLDEKDIEGLHFEFKPLTYDQMSQYSMQNYILQRQLVGLPEDWSDEEKEKHIKDIMKQSTQLNLDLILEYIKEVSAADQKENNPEAISEFIKSADTKIYNAIKEHISKVKDNFDNVKIDVTCPAEDCGHEFQTAIELDYSSFFVQRS